MSQDVANSSLVSQQVLEKNLIDALTRLQHTAFDNEFLNDKAAHAEELPPEYFFGFAIGAYSFLVSANCFCEVFVDTPIAALPNAPACLLGLCNIRGVLIPVYQLHSGLNITSTQKATIFCVGKGDSAIGLLIDSLPISLSLNAHQQIAHADTKNLLLQPLILQPLIKATYLANNREWLLLNGNKFAEQLQTIANLSQIHSASLKNTHATAYP
jgi:chemotaxis signal transduction protein